MTLIELFVPTGALAREQQRQLSRNLVDELLAAPAAPAELIERGRAITTVVVHEPVHWSVGGRDVDRTDPPRYIVRVSVPGGHITDRIRAEIVARITRVLAAADDDPQRFHERPDAWIHIIEVPDGNLGAYGRIMPTDAITDLLVRGTLPTPAGMDHHRPAATIDSGPATHDAATSMAHC